MMDWNLKTLEEKLIHQLFGRRLHYFSDIESTNDEAFTLGRDGAAEGTAVIAERQSRGRGRFQRSWHSPAGANIYTSIILRPTLPPEAASRIPIMAGVAVADTLASYCSANVRLKWPNDILIKDKKVCGILSRAKISEKKIDFIVLGIGLNVNMKPYEFTEEIIDSATSLAMETGRDISREYLIIHLYENLEKWYKKLQQKGFGPVKKRWLELAPMIGQKVQVIFKGELIKGTATGMDNDGHLLVLDKNNREVKVSTGDATIMR
jgi:BirA family biotin operon repressor/biotin-[acetyl-CoA-carboxylase] ligase